MWYLVNSFIQGAQSFKSVCKHRIILTVANGLSCLDMFGKRQISIVLSVFSVILKQVDEIVTLCVQNSLAVVMNQRPCCRKYYHLGTNLQLYLSFGVEFCCARDSERSSIFTPTNITDWHRNPYVCRLKSGETVARMGNIKLVTLIGYRDFRFYSSLIYFL